MNSRRRTVADQVTGSVVEKINTERVELYYERIRSIDVSEQLGIKRVDKNLLDALSQVKRVEEFISEPNKILGSMATKHGEIAEEVDVAFTNAWDIMKGLSPSATFDGVGRTAPEDYLVLDVPVQSKYINGASNTLSHVIEHLNKYEGIGFGRNDSYYVIPKDQYNQILNILDGENEGFSIHTVNAIKNKVVLIEELTGKTFVRAVHSGNVDYAEVQLGAVNKTLNREKVLLQNEASNEKRDIRSEGHNSRQKAFHESRANLGEALQAAAAGAVISGSMKFVLEIYVKHKERKGWKFTAKDWMDIGKSVGLSSAKGGISGSAIYGISNSANIPGAQAAGYVSALFGICHLASQFHSREISEQKFIEGSELVCINSALATIGGTLGQTMIPIPILGAVIGSTIANQISHLGLQFLTEKDKVCLRRLESRMKVLNDSLTAKYRCEFDKLMKKLNARMKLMYDAFDDNLDARTKFLKTRKYGRKIGADISKMLRPQSRKALKYFMN